MEKLSTKSAQQSIPTTGDTKELQILRDDVEKWNHVLARATFQALSKLGRTADAAKADLTPSDLGRSRAVALAGTAEMEPLSVAPAGGGVAPGKASGVTPELVAKVADLWSPYGTAVGAPSGARARRAALTDELSADVRAIRPLS